MIELKVHCDCGQKFKFDVEPVNNRMPFTVACPVCGADGTGKANDLLQQMTAFKLIEPSSAPASVTPPPAPPISQAPRIRVNVPAQPAAAVAPPPIAPVATAPASSSRPGTRFGAPAAGPGIVAQPGRKPSFALGLLGAFLGALVGAIIYYLVFKLSGWRLGLMALVVGGLAGWGANFLGRGEGSKELGLITAILVVAGVIAAQYFVALGWWHEGLRGVEDAGYSATVAIAKDVVKTIPTGSDAEIRNYLAGENADEGDKPDPQAVSDDDVKQFRDKRLPEFQNLAGGKETKEQYFAKNGIDLKKMQEVEVEADKTFKGVFLLLLLNKLGLISLIAAGGLAYRFSANA